MLDRTPLNGIIASFDHAAPAYDAAALLQFQVAKKLLRHVTHAAPKTILDIGCGTGHVTLLAAQKWPQAQITALDASPAMLREAQKKVPHLQLIQADAATLNLTQKFDLILSSMALHWLPQPRRALEQWKNLLTPHGQINSALPTTGSLQEWRDLCRKTGIEEGLWNFPAADFAQGLAQTRLEQEKITYANPHEFLRNIKQTGAHQPRSGHKPALLRRLLRQKALFTATYNILYLTITV